MEKPGRFLATFGLVEDRHGLDRITGLVSRDKEARTGPESRGLAQLPPADPEMAWQGCEYKLLPGDPGFPKAPLVLLQKGLSWEQLKSAPNRAGGFCSALSSFQTGM